MPNQRKEGKKRIAVWLTEEQRSQEIVVTGIGEDQTGKRMAVFLRSLLFGRHKVNGLVVPGEFVFLMPNDKETFKVVVTAVVNGLYYLSGGGSRAKVGACVYGGG